MDIYSGRDIFDRHLRFLEEVVSSHDWGDEEHRRLGQAIDRLKARIVDPCVNISVVGEFSSGKSSMINALVGMDLLETDELPDTTLVPAVLVYGEKPSFEILYLDGKKKKFKGTIGMIREKFREYSLPDIETGGDISDEAYRERLFEARSKAVDLCADIRQFIVRIPSPFLKAGFRIFDTPGLSSSNPKCGEMAESTMKESDLSIIVANATTGVLVENIRYYLESTIKDRLAYCAMVFTKYDLITRRDKVETYLKSTIPGYFDLTPEQLPVYMAVPPTVTAELAGKEFGSEHREMLRITRETIDKLIFHAMNHREKAIANSLIRLTKEVYDRLSDDIPKLKKGHEERLAQLARSAVFPVTRTVTAKRKRHENNLHAKKAEFLAGLDGKLGPDSIHHKEQIRSSAASQSSVSDLDKYLKEHLGMQMETRMKSMSSCGRKYLKDFSKNVKAELRDFETLMQEEFRELGITPVDLKLSIRSLKSNPEINEELNSVVKMGADEKDSQENAVIFSVIGGIVGSIITFGIGTGIGAFIGAWLGGKGKSRSIDSVRGRVLPELERKLDEGFQKHRKAVINWYTTEANNLISGFSSLLDGYQTKYRRQLSRLKKEEEKKQKSVRGEIAKLEETLRQIKINQEELDNLWITK